VSGTFGSVSNGFTHTDRNWLGLVVACWLVLADRKFVAGGKNFFGERQIQYR
jgi:hypothetical protein